MCRGATFGRLLCSTKIERGNVQGGHFWKFSVQYIYRKKITMSPFMKGSVQYIDREREKCAVGHIWKASVQYIDRERKMCSGPLSEEPGIEREKMCRGPLLEVSVQRQQIFFFF